MEKLGSYWTNFREILFLSVFLKYYEKIELSLKTLLENMYTILIISRGILLRTISASNRSCRKVKTRFISATVCKIVSFMRQFVKNIMQPDRPQMTAIRRICCACWMTKATDTHSEYSILIACTYPN